MSSTIMRKVVITGMGVVSSLGSDLQTFWKNNINGVSGIRKVTKFDVSRYPCQIGGEVQGLDMDKFMSKKDQRRNDLYCHYAIAAAKMAIMDSGIDFSKEDPTMCGSIIGSGIGGLRSLEIQHDILREKGPDKCSPFMIPQMIVNMASGIIAIEYGLKGPNYSAVSACASAGHAIGAALRTIQHGEADIMITGGADAAICELGYAGFCALRALTTTHNHEPEKGSRPFDKDRNGFVMGEGAGCMVIEEYEHAKKRGAKIYCELSGFGATCDAYHETAPSPDGEGAARAMLAAIKDSGETPEAVDYINAHGTSTELNDKCETLAVKRALGEQHAKKVMISSTKSMVGHTLGAAGGIEGIACALAIHYGIIPPTINYTTPDPECDLDYVPNAAREKKIRFALSNSLGFGGHNATLAFRAI